MPPLIDLTGQRFGRLLVECRDGASEYGQPTWRCRCDCGEARIVFGNALRTGVTQSCGCLHAEAVTTHGGTGTSEFTIWQMMRQRCQNPAQSSYANYGGRGITVCPEWDASFAAFLADMGPRPSRRHTIDRRDNERGYSPGNCYWATPHQQGQNKRNNHVLELHGERFTLAEWCRRLGMKQSTLLNRLARGMSERDALTRPTKGRRARHG